MKIKPKRKKIKNPIHPWPIYATTNLIQIHTTFDMIGKNQKRKGKKKALISNPLNWSPKAENYNHAPSPKINKSNSNH